MGKEIKLLPHNIKTYDALKSMVEKGDKRIGVVQPTGTGKSFLVAMLFQDYPQATKLVVSPSKHINRQVSKLCDANQPVTYMTYAKLIGLEPSEWLNMTFDMIVLDEFHRCGAETWGMSVEVLLEMNADSLAIGLSATPVRHLDNQKDMGELLFGNNLAVNMTLVDAMASGILPVPKYVAALYTFDLLVNEAMEKINQSKNSKEQKLQLMKQVIKARKQLEKSNGAEAILKKHFDLNTPKTIVFCKSREHLEAMKPMVVSWFINAFKNVTINTYEIFSIYGDKHNNQVIQRFEEANEGIPILFAIDMLNEGLHISSVANLILLRPTESPLVFYQQLGRALVSGGGVRPKVFDLVNNVKTVNANLFRTDLEEVFARNGYAIGSDEVAPYEVYDEVLEVEELFKTIESNLMCEWDLYYLALKAFKETYNHVNVSSLYVNDEGLRLGRWGHAQKYAYACGTMQEDRVEKLRELGFNLEKESFDSRWRNMFVMLEQFHATHGHFMVPGTPEYDRLRKWCVQQRQELSEGTLSEERVSELNRIGFKASYKDSVTEYYLGLCIEAIRDNIEITTQTRRYKGVDLYTWTNKFRKLYENGELQEEYMEQLEAAGFTWARTRSGEDYKLKILTEWVELYGVENLRTTTTYKGLKVGSWVLKMNKAYKAGTVDKIIIQHLENLRIPLGDIKQIRWNNTYQEYKDHLNKDKQLNAQHLTRVLTWAKRQRAAKHNNTLEPWQVQKLDRIGFDWGVAIKPERIAWDTYYEQLEKYVCEHGNCNVRTEYNGYMLHKWAREQRSQYAQKKLKDEYKAKLDTLGFIWDIPAYDWYQNYLLLKAYYREYGTSHLTTTQVYKGKKLGSWARGQRNRYANNMILQDQQDLLEKLEFKWHNA